MPVYILHLQWTNFYNSIFQTALPSFQQRHMSVVRCHEEFIWLHDMLNENPEYAGYIVSVLHYLLYYLLHTCFVGSAVIASLLYGLQHCSFGKREQRCLDGYFLRLAKLVMRLPHHFHLSYTVAEERLGVKRPSTLVAKERLRWIGHALRSDDTVLLEVLTYVPEGGARGRGRPRRRFFDTIKTDLSARGINIDARDQKYFLARARRHFTRP